MQRIKLIFCACYLFFVTAISSQSAFDCTGQRIYFDPVNQVFGELMINPSNGALQFPVINPGSFNTVLAIGYSSTNRIIYILESGTNLLHLYYADGSLTTLPTVINLPIDLEYKAGEISPDGRDFYVIGSRLGLDRSIFKINLTTGNYEVTEIPLPGLFDIQEIAFDPLANYLYMYEDKERQVLKLNLDNFNIQGLLPTEDFREIDMLYFDAFGDLYGLGSTQFGVASGLSRINKENGEETLLATGPVAFIEEGTSCPYTVAMYNEPSSLNSFPCEELTYTYSIANATMETQSNLTFRTELPPGFLYKSVIHSTIGGTSQFDSGKNEFTINNISIPRGIHEIKLLVELDEFVSEGRYLNQGEIIGLPQTLGGTVLSDYKRTPREDDPSPVTIDVVEDDSLFFTRFICTGQSTILDGSIYGVSFIWSNGSTESEITVDEAGSYLLRARTGCADVFIEFEVTVASCPFRLDMDHLPVPDSTFPCTEILYEFVIDNSTGVIQNGILFTDTLPVGITFLDIVLNPFGGKLEESLVPHIVRIDDMTIPVGIDTMRFLVEVGEIDPGNYQNQARLDNLPLELGTFRVSDDPRTIGLDSTDTTVLGVETDSLYVPLILCKGQTQNLDASIYGTRFIWFNGSTESMVIVDKIGLYQVDVFNGCQESKVFFDVMEGAPIDVDFSPDVVLLNLGDTIQLKPNISNRLDSLSLQWSGTDTASLSCHQCPAPFAFPLLTNRFQVKADNGVCMDSAIVKILIDNSRRFFLPNVFTPNGDRNNDFLGIYSPDFGLVNSFEVFDRSGNLVFSSSITILNEPTTGWDGRFDQKYAPAGVYYYNFEITFLDGFTRNYTGNVTLLR